MSKGTVIKVACDIYWAFTNKPAEMSGKYEVTLGNLSEAAVTNLTGMGIEVRFREDKPEQGNFIVCKSTMPIEVVDAAGVPITAMIGNGSKAIAKVGAYEWTFKNKKGTSPSLRDRLVVTELVRVGADETSEVF